MKLTIDRDLILNTLSTASRFVSDKLNTQGALQGAYILPDNGSIHVYSTNLTTYYHTTLLYEGAKKEEGKIVEPKKIVEFLQLLQPGPVEIAFDEKQCTISQNKTKGSFPLVVSEEFPTPPEIAEKGHQLTKKFLTEVLPLVLFTTSKDDSRPILTGVNFVVQDNELIIVATDGFRLSLVKSIAKEELPPMIVPADFLDEIIRSAKQGKETQFTYSEKEKIIRFTVDQEEYYSRLIEGEFPPYERVIPSEKATTITLDREELVRNTKLISIFARDFSNVIVYNFTKNALRMQPKEDGNKENEATQDIELVGEEQQVALNYKYVLDFLNHTHSKKINIEILRPDAPIVFFSEGEREFLHIIMPVRIQGA